jgi:hypothetical protein
LEKYERQQKFMGFPYVGKKKGKNGQQIQEEEGEFEEKLSRRRRRREEEGDGGEDKKCQSHNDD